MVEIYKCMAELWGNKHNGSDNLNCKMQAHARVHKENKIELKENKNDTYWNNFVVRGVSLKDHIGRVGNILRWYSQGWFTVT